VASGGALFVFDPLLPIGIRLDQAGVDREAFPADQPLTNAAPQHRLKHASQQIALAEAAMSVLRKGRMVGYVAVEPESAEPAVCQVEMNLLTKSSLGADAEAVADDQHPDHQFGIDRGPPNGAVKRCQLPPQLTKLHEPIDRA
jgi:hypothetical protein